MAECRNRILLKLALFQAFCYTGTIRKAVSMCQKFTPEQLNSMDHETKNDVIYQMQDRLDKLEHDYENLMEQIRLANQ